MRAEAVAFLRTLTPEQRRLAVFGIDSHERLDWHYIPRERPGLPLKAMDDRQRDTAHALLRAVLSEVGYRKATDIMRLETVLRAIEKVRRFDRDPDNYAWIVFGDPRVVVRRSEEHTSELQSRLHLVCRLLLEKKKNHDKLLVLVELYIDRDLRRVRPLGGPKGAVRVLGAVQQVRTVGIHERALQVPAPDARDT